MEMKIKDPSSSPEVFYSKLTEFHQTTGSSLILSVACSVLDLYSFYKEVTARGGYLQVSRGGRWREVASALNYSNSSPQPALLLQNVYSNLLYQFERTYDFTGQKDCLISQGSGLLSGSAPINNASPDYPSSFGENPIATRSSTRSNESYGENLENQVGSSICGVIEKEVECGYLISVIIGTEKLNGVLYQVNNLVSTEQFAVIPSPMSNGVVFEDSDSEHVRSKVLACSSTQAVRARSSTQAEPSTTLSSSKHMVKKDRKRLDKEAPLSNRSAYQFFLIKECDRLKKEYGKKAKIRQMAVDAWKCLSERDREPYVEESRKDKERFEHEMVTYNDRKATYNERKGTKSKKISKPELYKDYCVPIEFKKQDDDDISVAGFAEIMGNAAQLDATMQIEMDDEFLSLH